MDSQFLLEEQGAAIVSSPFIQMHHMHQLHPFLECKVALRITHALVPSHLFWCNTHYCTRFRVVLNNVQIVLQSGPKCSLDQLLNAVIPTMLGAPLNAPITPLHWLPVGFGVQFKVLLVTYKAPHGQVVWDCLTSVVLCLPDLPDLTGWHAPNLFYETMPSSGI